MCMNMPSINNGSFTSRLPFFLPFIPFTQVTKLKARTSGPVLNRSNEDRQSWPLPSHKGKNSVFKYNSSVSL